MNLQSNLSWFFSIFAFVSLFAGGSYLLGNTASAEAEMISFSDLSNADMDLILMVKDEMRTAQVQMN